ncbi:Hypp9595 [Branchiostoma lanceolatum]|uniref:Hypp9595 protein n=1 Tax=Branchiostoma lanceolatum TaxID=7740 RepID=A0A8S4MPD6_BRALA|nr:Hypp9595 [Branchiostoma lanceolatum]
MSVPDLRGKAAVSVLASVKVLPISLVSVVSQGLSVPADCPARRLRWGVPVAPATGFEPESAASDVPATAVCLSCRADFPMSEGPGAASHVAPMYCFGLKLLGCLARRKGAKSSSVRAKSSPVLGAEMGGPSLLGGGVPRWSGKFGRLQLD